MVLVGLLFLFFVFEPVIISDSRYMQQKKTFIPLSGMYAFVSSSNNINGSVFLHFLSKVLIEYGDNEDLATMLLRVTREVAVSYESYVPEDDKINKNKQIPYTVSTLMRKLVFFCPKYK